MATICLRRRSPGVSSDRYPRAQRATVSALLFGLAPGGVCLAGRSPGRRWALTPPFHPYPTAPLRRQTPPGGVISVALSFGSPRLGITQRPALWSPDFPPTVFNYVGGHPSASTQAKFYPDGLGFLTLSSSAMFTSLSAPRFSSRPTWLTVTRSPNCCRSSVACLWSSFSSDSFTLHLPLTCSTTSLESR